jgi:hypothetical protein
VESDNPIGYFYWESEVPGLILAGAGSDFYEDLWSSRMYAVVPTKREDPISHGRV